MSVNRVRDGLITLYPGGDRKGSVHYLFFVVDVVDKYGCRFNFSKVSWVVSLVADFCKLFVSSCHLIWLDLWGNVLFIHNFSTFLHDGIYSILSELT